MALLGDKHSILRTVQELEKRGAQNEIAERVGTPLSQIAERMPPPLPPQAKLLKEQGPWNEIARRVVPPEQNCPLKDCKVSQEFMLISG